MSSFFRSELKSTLKRLINGRLLAPVNLKLYSTQAFGREISQDIRNIRPDPNVMFDVGANVGQTVKLWSEEYPNPEIHSFEPVRRLFESLTHEYGDIAICNHLGVGNENTSLTIHYGVHDVSHSFKHTDVEKGGEQVDVVTLDAYCQKNNIPRIDVLKIDVEGFEAEVLQGGHQLLSEAAVDLIVMEVGFDPNGYYSYYPELADRLLEYGYKTLGFYDQTTAWDGSCELLFCNALFARPGLSFNNV